MYFLVVVWAFLAFVVQPLMVATVLRVLWRKGYFESELHEQVDKLTDRAQARVMDRIFQPVPLEHPDKPGKPLLDANRQPILASPVDLIVARAVESGVEYLTGGPPESEEEHMAELGRRSGVARRDKMYRKVMAEDLMDSANVGPLLEILKMVSPKLAEKLGDNPEAIISFLRTPIGQQVLGSVLGGIGGGQRGPSTYSQSRPSVGRPGASSAFFD